MKKSYCIEVDCANCALKMEETIKKVPGVEDAAISFMAQKLMVSFEEGSDPDETMKAVVKACKKAVSDGAIYL